MLRPLKYLVLALLVLSFGTAGAVQVNSSSEGEVLIFPLVSSTAEHDTLLQISAGGFTAGALKVTIRGRSGAVDQAFNLYINGDETWTAAVTASGGSSELRANEDGCMITGAGAVDTISLASSVGYMEVIFMGRIESEAAQNEVLDDDCEALADRWATGPWSFDPSAGMATSVRPGLNGSAAVINVLRGDLYSYQPTALINFTDTTLHTAPSVQDSPDLASMNNAGRSTDFFYSTFCDRGRCVEDEWNSGIDAVSAALTKLEFSGRFEIEEAVEAKTDWIVLYPTIAYYPEASAISGGITEDHTEVRLLIKNRAGRSFIARIPCVPLPDAFCGDTYSIFHDQSLEVISFNNSMESETEVPSALLGISHTPQFPNDDIPELPAAGTADLTLVDTGSTPEMGSFLISNDGSRYRGRPAIAIGMQQYVNGFLLDQDGKRVLSTYGVTAQLNPKIDNITEEP